SVFYTCLRAMSFTLRPRQRSSFFPYTTLFRSSVPDSTRTVLEKILTADATTGEQVARLRPQAGSTPTATSVLDHVEALLTRIDALVGAEQLQSLRPSAGEVTMLEGIACRSVPDLVDDA